jgi:hypothetical protein
LIAKELSQSFYHLPEAWDRFWFRAAPTRRASVFRFAVGTVAAIHFLSFFAWVPQWLCGDGWFDLETGRYLIGVGLPDTGSQYRWSPLFVATQPWAGYVVCGTGLLASIAMVLGMGTRVAPLVAWLCMLTIHHRAPWLSMPGEILLTAGLFYLLIDTGRTTWTVRPGFDDSTERISANLAVRCGQIHLLIWLIFSAISMFQYNVWWNGSAVSVLSQQVNGWLGEIASSSYFGQFCTMAIPCLQLAGAFFLARRSTLALGLLCLSTFAASVALLAGDWLYSLALIAMGTVFISAPSSTPCSTAERTST